MAHNLTGLVTDLFDILQETKLSKDDVKGVMFDFLVSLEDNLFVDGAEYEFEDCLGNHRILDDAINEYLDSVSNPDDYDEDEDDE